MLCPKCKTNTLNDFGMVEGVQIDFCSGCKGIWFDAGELAFYVEAAADVPDMTYALSSGRATDLPCPRCSSTALVETRYSAKDELLVDICPACKGIFLDAGELPKVETIAARTGGLEKIMNTARALESKGYMILGAGENTRS